MTAKGLFSCISLLVTFACARPEVSEALQQPDPATPPVSNSTFDYIVVGGGAAGLVVSERLAETGKTVLLLERGGPSLFSSGGGGAALTSWNDTLTVYDVPSLFYSLPGWPGLNAWCTDVPAGVQAGCILGGGTVLNSMQFVRPPTFDFDDKWPIRWRWTDVEEAAKRLYGRISGTIVPSADGKYYDNDVWDVTSKFFSLGGYKEVNTNEETDEKFKAYSHPALSIEGGFRVSPVNTYLPLAMKLPNFKLQLHTKVIRTARVGPTITGVEVEDQNGRRYLINIKPGGKVVLAAGSMSTPRILFNSAIGPVTQINIVKNGTTKVTLPPRESWIESPVGFVRDHAIAIITFNVPGGTNVLNQAEFTHPRQEWIDLYAQGSGPLAQSWNRLMSYSTVINDDGHKTFWQTHAASTTNNTVTFLVAITHNATSTGRLGITYDGNTTYTENPILRSASDKEAMTRAIDQLLAISRLPDSPLSYSPANATGASILKAALSGSDPSLVVINGSHMTGTAIMGTDDGTKNGSSVVDTNCKVYGTDNLFVVDASMHPDLPTGNTQAIVMVAAEHAARKIIALDDPGYTMKAPR